MHLLVCENVCSASISGLQSDSDFFKVGRVPQNYSVPIIHNEPISTCLLKSLSEAIFDSLEFAWSISGVSVHLLVYENVCSAFISVDSDYDFEDLEDGKVPHN